MTTKEKYENVIKNIVRKPLGTFAIVDGILPPEILFEKDKTVETSFTNTFSIELNYKATENDMKDYIDYILKYTNQYNVDFDSDNDFENWEN